MATQQLIGRRVRRRRTELGMTLAVLARSVGVSVGSLSRMENGERVASLPTLVGLCAVLRLRVEDVLDPLEEPAARVVWATGHLLNERGPAGLSVQTVAQQGSPSLLMVNAVLDGGGSCAVHGPGVLVAVQAEGYSLLNAPGSEYVLEPGDALTFSTRGPIIWVNKWPTVSRALWTGIPDVRFESPDVAAL
ncbi:helix-turn-helix domain-containing protein [Pseudarthrobacter sp. AG30]|uniref:helix-turn-helix domain-containing protein n=1 Tax=Pseudarthrobacter sp. AG30 TaxID=2249742 RepID=UPI0034CE85B2